MYFYRVCLPKIPDIAEKSLQQLIDLRITQIWWFGDWSLGFILSDGQSYKANKFDNAQKRYTFDQTKKITRVEVIIMKDNGYMIRINFISGTETIVKIGDFTDADVVLYGEIA